MSERPDVTFDVPEFDGPTVVFGAPLSAYLTREQMGEDFYSARHPMTAVASQLFFKGGKLADYGLHVKPSLDRDRVLQALHALLCSFEPKHEIKIGTVGYALSQWCDPVSL